MKYSILGFNQESVLGLRKIVIDSKSGKEKIVNIDIVDLLILRDVSDFANRTKTIKYVINDKTYFNVKYSTIINDLPILGIKQQALSDRLSKLCSFGLLEKEVMKNQSGSLTVFRVGYEYEKIMYNDNDFRTRSELQVRTEKSDAHVVDYKCYNISDNNINNNSITNNNKTINNNNNNDDNNNKSKELKEKFFLFVDLYKKLTKTHVRGKDTEFNDFVKRHKNWKEIIPYLPIAIQRETNDREQAKASGKFFPMPKMLQTYLGKQKAWEMYVTIGENIDDIKNEYHPSTGGNLNWNDYYNCYIYMGMFIDDIADGYNDENRPDGASLMLNNGRGNIAWNKKEKKWIKK